MSKTIELPLWGCSLPKRVRARKRFLKVLFGLGLLFKAISALALHSTAIAEITQTPRQGTRLISWVSGIAPVVAVEPESLKFQKRWSGRPGSNRRRPAWEIDCRLKIQINSVYGVNEWR